MKRVVVFIVLAMVVIGSCAAQSAEAQKLVGTWVSDNGITYVLNANGTGTGSGHQYETYNGNIFWGVSISGELLIASASNTASNYKDTFYLSPDGRRMIWRGNVYQKR
jgi:hypothetical protein